MIPWDPLQWPLKHGLLESYDILVRSITDPLRVPFTVNFLDNIITLLYNNPNKFYNLNMIIINKKGKHSFNIKINIFYKIYVLRISLCNLA